MPPPFQIYIEAKYVTAQDLAICGSSKYLENKITQQDDTTFSCKTQKI